VHRLDAASHAPHQRELNQFDSLQRAADFLTTEAWTRETNLRCRGAY